MQTGKTENLKVIDIIVKLKQEEMVKRR